MTAIKSDTFSGGAGALDASYTQQRTTGTVNRDGSGNAIAGTLDGDMSAFDNSNTYPNDHYSKVRIGTVATGNAFVGAMTRAAGTGDASYDNYTAYTDGASGGGSTELVEYLNGSQTVLRNYATTFTTGDWYDLQSKAGIHEAFKNGVSLGTHSDATLASGSAGIWFWDVSAGATPTLTEWESGDFLVAPGTAFNRGMAMQQRFA